MAIYRQAWNSVFGKAKTYKGFLSSLTKNLIVNSYIVFPVKLSSLMMNRYEPKHVADSVV